MMHTDYSAPQVGKFGHFARGEEVGLKQGEEGQEACWEMSTRPQLALTCIARCAYFRLWYTIAGFMFRIPKVTELEQRSSAAIQYCIEYQGQGCRAQHLQ